ncbi:MAG: hypothetical protein K2Q24_08270 [Chitinophagaceae bacterium]|jgi:hypothetical protein|nr:hypothetical protein [Chitinophagaceae bacterium]
MPNQIEITGQWKGSFWYGPEYGAIEGESVEFMMFLEAKNGEFEGKCFEMGGVGVSPNADLALIKGFIKDGVISFVKKYNHATFFDEDGNVQDDFFKPSHEIIYHGEYTESDHKFLGDWEIVTKVEDSGGDMIEYLCTGTWEMKKEIE